MKDKEEHTNKVTVLEVVTIQLVARLLRVHHVLIDDEGGALGIAGNALPNLAIFPCKQEASSCLCDHFEHTELGRTSQRGRTVPLE
jgi:hypothetical protein